MCDYSLHDVASRPARVGDRLMTKSFLTTCTHGFVAVGAPNVAVCLLPGTELAFEKEVQWDRTFLLFRRKRSLGKLVRFRQVNTDIPQTHHHAVEFPNGKIVLLTALCEGQKARVLQLPAASQAVQRVRHSETGADADPRVIDLVATHIDPWGYIIDPWV
jgi:hypothetical protein